MKWHVKNKNKEPTCSQKSSILGFPSPLGEQEKPPPEMNNLDLDLQNQPKFKHKMNQSFWIYTYLQFKHCNWQDFSIATGKSFSCATLSDKLPMCINWWREDLIDQWEFEMPLVTLQGRSEGCWHDIYCSDEERLLQFRVRSSLSSIGTTRHHQLSLRSSWGSHILQTRLNIIISPPPLYHQQVSLAA